MIRLAPIDRDTLLQQVNQLARGVSIPAEFDPLHASSEQLAEFDLPSRPNASEPELLAFWTEMFSPPLQFKVGDISYASSAGSNVRSVGRAVSGSRYRDSLNWSGASITARNGRMFTDVFATWIVPTVSVPIGGAPNVEYKSSCFVGLDGQRSYADSTLPQLGTEQGINKNGQASPPGASVWIQWWPMDVMTIASLPVSFGDRVYCWLTAQTHTKVRCMFKVGTAPGPLHVFYLHAPSIQYTLPPDITLGAKITGATAEWITEAPTSEVTGEIFPLPDYGQVEFQQCYALSRVGPGQPYEIERLVAPTLTRMYKVDRSTGRRVTISTPPTVPVPPLAVGHAPPPMAVVKTLFVG